jgi:hypothetical protein
VFSEVFIAEEVAGVGSRGQEIPLLHRHSWRPFGMSPRPSCFIRKAFSWKKAKLLVLRQLSSAAGLSGFLDNQKLD